MTIDPTKPLLRLDRPKLSERLNGKRRKLPGNKTFSRSRQQSRFEDQFDRVSQVLASSGSSGLITRDPTALLPETLLVFTVSGEIQNLARALKAIPGLELVGEDLEEDLGDSTDAEDEGDSFLYLMLPSQSALADIERFWRQWMAGDESSFSAPIRNLFACLKSIRRWSAQDRVSETDAEVLREIVHETPTRSIAVEVELVFRESAAQAKIAADSVVNAVKLAGGTLLHHSRHPEFSSDALLVELPAKQVELIIQRSDESLAGLDHVMSIGPQASISVKSDVSEGEIGHAPDELPGREPIAALFDAVPFLEHAYLKDRVHYDDPTDLQKLAVGFRVHGTAMASLIIHGDLNGEPSPPISRPLYMRPVMYARTAGSVEEVFPSDRLLVDDFYDAVVRMKAGMNGEPATAPSVLVINVSLGDNRRRFAGRMSRWARAIDDLSWRYGILFVVSAGNLDLEGLDDLPLTGFSDIPAFLAATPSAREAAVLAGVAAAIRDRSLLAPADAINALTIGAINRDRADQTAQSASGILPYDKIGSLPNPSSAPGLGYGRSIKPDILMAGGQEHVLPTVGATGVSVRPVPFNEPFGLKAAYPPFSRVASASALGFVGQTSTAAAIATRTAHRLHDVLETAYGSAFLGLSGRHRALLLKALLVHRARWTDAIKTIDSAFGAGLNWQRRRANATRLLGYGVVDHEDVLYCVKNRATAWAVGDVPKMAASIVSLPLPPSLSGQAVPKSIAVTLVWFSPTAPGRRSYKTTRLILTDLNGDDLGRLGLDKHEHQPDVNATRRGTVAHRVFTGAKAAAFVANERIEFRVQRERETGLGSDDDIGFAIAITIETDADLPVYDEVAIRLPIKPAVSITPLP
ncbi:S8 family peptidase (plasmid) [Rhizobium grahamii]|uniref:S8 family peptidase n=1 Tax=Rhizobium grahamii TaxID=1120045 RepID=A0A5Q0CA88_9HYPH|nr:MULTISPECIES: S8 family peptidase [Rhizobium]QFY62806.1 S8 family peptidase [Rhizobium grahamii]QRM52447.1 S8 family peptidase [Rhizobium sp. BG6]